MALLLAVSSGLHLQVNLSARVQINAAAPRCCRGPDIALSYFTAKSSPGARRRDKLRVVPNVIGGGILGMRVSGDLGRE